MAKIPMRRESSELITTEQPKQLEAVCDCRKRERQVCDICQRVTIREREKGE